MFRELNETEKKFLKDTIEKFEQAHGLSISDDGSCFYSPEINGIGCVLGCHLPEDVALRWDQLQEHAGATISAVWRVYPDEVEKYFPGLRVGFLELIQDLHDGSTTKSFFISMMKDLLEHREAVNETK